MTGRERVIAALNRQPLKGHVPHFELVFFLSREAVGIAHNDNRRFEKWDQLTQGEKKLHWEDMTRCFTDVAEKYQHDAIFAHSALRGFDNFITLLDNIRQRSGKQYFLMKHGDPTIGIPDGNNMMAMIERMYDDPEGLKAEAQKRLDDAIRDAEKFAKYPDLLDGYALCADYCFNTNPFFSPEQFAEFVAPYLDRIIREYRSMGFYAIKHTDGNIMPILDQMVDCNPHALHSIDPQAGVDLGEVKRLVGDKVCIIGNVNCGLLQTGTDEEVVEDARRALRQGMPGYGYIFSTSNCVYSGMELSRYELMHKVWREEGIYV